VLTAAINLKVIWAVRVPPRTGPINSLNRMEKKFVNKCINSLNRMEKVCEQVQ